MFQLNKIALPGLLLGALLLSGCQGYGEQNQASMAEVIDSAIADAARPAAAKARDQYRKPREVLLFSEIKPGDRIAEITPGGGYYTALLSRVVGDQGMVYAVDPERIFEYFPQGREGFPAYIKADPRPNVQYSSQNLDQISLPTNLDQIWMVLYYHDTLWTNENRAEMNRRFFDALKPGGSLIIIDHTAVAGAPAKVGETLHRMDPATAKRELLSAGFILSETSNLLSNPDDDLTTNVFTQGVRGNTDRFMWKLTKP